MHGSAPSHPARASIRAGSLGRHVVSISHCAALLPRYLPEQAWTGWDAGRLHQALKGRNGRHAIVAIRLCAVVAPGRHGALGDDQNSGLRELRDPARTQTCLSPAVRVERVARLEEAGGTMSLAETIPMIRQQADELPACSTAA